MNVAHVPAHRGGPSPHHTKEEPIAENLLYGKLRFANVSAKIRDLTAGIARVAWFVVCYTNVFFRISPSGKTILDSTK